MFIEDQAQRGGFRPRLWWFDVDAGVRWFASKNDHFRRFGIDVAEREQKKDPVFSTEAHITYDINRKPKGGYSNGRKI